MRNLVAVKIGQYYVSPKKMGSNLPLSKSPNLFIKKSEKGSWFSLQSLETGQFVRSAGGNDICCDRSKVGDNELFEIKNGGIYCTTGGGKDRW